MHAISHANLSWPIQMVANFINYSSFFHFSFSLLREFLFFFQYHTYLNHFCGFTPIFASIQMCCGCFTKTRISFVYVNWKSIKVLRVLNQNRKKNNQHTPIIVAVVFAAAVVIYISMFTLDETLADRTLYLWSWFETSANSINFI